MEITLLTFSKYILRGEAIFPNIVSFPTSDAVPTVFSDPTIFKRRVWANFSEIRFPNKFPESMSALASTLLLAIFTLM